MDWVLALRRKWPQNEPQNALQNPTNDPKRKQVIWICRSGRQQKWPQSKNKRPQNQKGPQEINWPQPRRSIWLDRCQQKWPQSKIKRPQGQKGPQKNELAATRITEFQPTFLTPFQRNGLNHGSL
jgi:hypothetical protein